MYFEFELYITILYILAYSVSISTFTSWLSKSFQNKLWMQNWLNLIFNENLLENTFFVILYEAYI